MTSQLTRAIGVSVALLLASAANAQESVNRVAANTDWSVFVEGDPTECWGVSAPKETTFTRDGQSVSARTDPPHLFVFYRPAEGVTGQVAYTGGYAFAGGSTVSLVVGDTTFDLFTEGAWAWPATPEDDAIIVTAMKGGAEAIIAGRSGRGTVVTHKFSLLGFTASIDEAARRCAG